ncbi:uncharacterized protein JCM15063_001813 [Sporobolomyces koalae]|uniref:uncharacterized protein n=1 Tax=Sporobolomyces koalae TaxID=500713 RepID=UPI003176A69D
MSTKDTLRQLNQLFSGPALQSSSAFSQFDLPDEVYAKLDHHLRTFASSFPLTAATGSSGQSEGERERARWREGLLEIWALVEPLPGTERDSLAKVSAFLRLLYRLSADAGNDDESALVSRKDIGAVWWNAVLRRTMLGTANDGETRYPHPADKTRGRKTTRKGKESAPAASTTGSTMRPLYVSRQGLTAATKTVVWGMAAAKEDAEKGDDYVSPFGLVVLREYEERSLARLKGLDEDYGVTNLGECVSSWGEQSPKAFFVRVAPLITTQAPSRLPALSLALSYLTKHSAKSYYALDTPLLSNIINISLLSPCPAIVNLAIKCLAIFLVTLPVIIGDNLFGIMAAFGRVVSWETFADDGDSRDPSPDRAGDPLEDDLESTPPDPTILFTVLYGIYPCNFTAFLKDATTYLREKNWQKPAGEGAPSLNSAMIRARSHHIIRLHTLSPNLFTSELASELSDTTRWQRMEAADVMAACDRNVVDHVRHMPTYDWRGDATAAPSIADTDPQPNSVNEGMWPPRELSSKRSRSSMDRRPAGSPPASGTTTPYHPLHAPTSPPMSPVDRAMSKQRVSTSSGYTSPSPSRTPTPHMPANSHFANFQMLQWSGQVGAAVTSPRRSGSRLRSTDAGVSAHDPLSWSGVFDVSQGGPAGPASLSRRSSGAPSLASMNTGGGTPMLSPEFKSLSLYSDPRPPSSAPGAFGSVSNQITKLETEVVQLQGEVNFQTYLKQLHLQHMGTVHREKVLESGQEAERQSRMRTIRTLRAQLSTAQSSLDQLRSEQKSTKDSWSEHINDLKDKLATLRKAKLKWDEAEKGLKAEVEDWKDRYAKKGKELEQEGAAFLDLRNQVSIDEPKLARVAEYELRIEALTRTLAICDADIAKYVLQRKEIQLIVGEYKRSEMLRAAVEEEAAGLKALLRAKEADLALLRDPSKLDTPPASIVPTTTSKSELDKLRGELARLRSRNLELEEKLLDLGEDDGM